MPEPNNSTERFLIDLNELFQLKTENILVTGIFKHRNENTNL